ncbi:MAG: hypothetical protein ABEJ93_01865 [Candidatus Nanohalobium sp.]
MASPTLLLIFGVVASVALVSYLAGGIYKSISDAGDQAMVKMKLHSDKVVQEFKALAVITGFETFALLIVFYGGLTSQNFYVNIGRGLTIIQGVVVAIVFYRWNRRLK